MILKASPIDLVFEKMYIIIFKFKLQKIQCIVLEHDFLNPLVHIEWMNKLLYFYIIVTNVLLFRFYVLERCD
jgi:hypothetical protein